MSVFGRLSTNSIQRGYFQGPIDRFTCAFNSSIERPARAAVPSLEHDEGLRLDQAIVILGRNDGRFEDAGVSDECLFDFEGRHPDATHLEHVVGAATVDVNAVGPAEVLVAGACPLALESAARLGALIPISGGGGGCPHEQFADCSVDDLALLPRRRAAFHSRSQARRPCHIRRHAEVR